MKRVAAAGVVLSIPLMAVAQPCAPQWSEQFAPPALVYTVFHVAVHDDGNGEALHAIGSFDVRGKQGSVRFAGKWTGTHWSPLWDYWLSTLVDTASWDPDGSGPLPRVLVVASQAQSYGSLPANYIAQWDGIAMTSMDGGMDDVVWSVTTFDPDGPGPQQRLLIAGGNFSVAGGVAANRVAAWNGSGWSPLGPGVSGNVKCMLTVEADEPGHPGPRLYVAGTGPLVYWDGNMWTHTGWSDLGNVRSMVWFDEDGPGPIPPSLYVGGHFSSAGGVPANNVARWDGSTWWPLGDGLVRQSFNETVIKLLVFDEDGDGPRLPRLHAVGRFSASGSQQLPHVARWTGAAWEPVPGAPAYGELHGATVIRDDFAGPGRESLCICGSFYQVDGRVIQAIAAWDGTRWRGLDSEHVPSIHKGMNGSVQAIANFTPLCASAPSTIVAGGFVSAGGTLVNGIAEWDGFTWRPLGPGAGGVTGGSGAYVNALVAMPTPNGDRLIVGGKFQSAGGVPARNVAVWDGVSWTSLGGGVGTGNESGVLALTRFDPDGPGPASETIFAAGDLRGSPRRYLAFWNGSTWVSIGGTINNRVRALAVHEGHLIIGGDFVTTSSPRLNHIARWDGATWSPLGPGMDGPVWGLLVHDGALYAAGGFTIAGNVVANGVARWKGEDWEALGNGFPMEWYEHVYTLGAFDNGSGPMLLAGGYFGVQGPSPIRSLARWTGQQWEEFGGGVFGGVFTLLPHDRWAGNKSEPTLYVGGSFLSVGGIQSSSFAAMTCATCYPDCDTQSGPGILDVFDFLCFGNRFDASDPYACDCDTSTGQGACDIFDFLCFSNAFSNGCP